MLYAALECETGGRAHRAGSPHEEALGTVRRQKSLRENVDESLCCASLNNHGGLWDLGAVHHYRVPASGMIRAGGHWLRVGEPSRGNGWGDGRCLGWFTYDRYSHR